MSCNKPFLMTNKNGDLVPVPCGRCLQCRIDKRNEWTMRLAFEVSENKGCFVTLTYDDIHLPVDLGLHKSDVQLFMKRLRKNLGKIKIKYYAVGEYGEKGNIITGLQRPHYHIILTGINALNALSPVSKSWQLGFTKCLPANTSSIRYTLKYLDKQLHGEQEKIEYGDKQPPFALMSQGIGVKWLYDNAEIIENMQGVSFNGKIRPIPRYYKDRLGIKSNSIRYSPDKLNEIYKVMKRENLTFIGALNYLGEINEKNLESEINLHNKS